MEINHIRPADMRGLNVFESPKESEVPFTGFALSFGGAFTQEFQGLAHQNSARRRGRDERRQREPAHHDRPRLQQRRRQPERERPDRPRDPRRDDVLPLGAAPPGIVGQGRLPARRRLADRQPAAQEHHEVHDAQGRALRDQLRRRALPPQRQRQLDVQSVRRQLHPRRLHDRDRRRSVRARRTA